MSHDNVLSSSSFSIPSLPLPLITSTKDNNINNGIDKNIEIENDTTFPSSSSSSPSPLDSLSSLLSPLSPLDYFDSFHDIETTPGMTFRLYSSFPDSSLSSSSSLPSPVAPLPFLCVFLHGGGQSSLSFSLVAKLLHSSFPLIAFDMRGHGDSHSVDHDEEGKIDISTLVMDVGRVMKKWSERCGYDVWPPLLMMGHSLGAAVAIRFAKALEEVVGTKLSSPSSSAISLSPLLSPSHLLPSPICGTVCIDIVETTALSTIPHIKTSLSSRPPSFPTIESAIEWSLRSGMMRNVEAARLSMRTQFKKISKKSKEEDEVKVNDNFEYIWRTDLLPSFPYWSDWFSLLSSHFLSLRSPKLLLLSNMETLHADVPLMIAHMQGKIIVHKVNDCGHQVMEDNSKETARMVKEFVERFQMKKWREKGQNQRALPSDGMGGKGKAPNGGNPTSVKNDEGKRDKLLSSICKR